MDVPDIVKRLVVLEVEAKAMMFGTVTKFGNPKIGPTTKILRLPEHNTFTDQGN